MTANDEVTKHPPRDPNRKASMSIYIPQDIIDRWRDLTAYGQAGAVMTTVMTQLVEALEACDKPKVALALLAAGEVPFGDSIVEKADARARVLTQPTNTVE